MMLTKQQQFINNPTFAKYSDKSSWLGVKTPTQIHEF